MPRYLAIIIRPDGTTKEQLFLDRRWIGLWFTSFSDPEKDVRMIRTFDDDALFLSDYDLELLKGMRIAAEVNNG